MKKKKYSHLSREERHVLHAYLKENLSFREIEKRTGRNAGGLCMEVKQHSKDGTRTGYEPDYAHLRSQFRKWDANRRKPLKSREIMEYVLEKLLEDQWSPEQIARTIQLDYPDNPVV